MAIVVIGLLEYRDTTFRSDADIIAALALPVVAVVPTLLTSSERRVNRRRRWMLSTSGLAVLVVAGAVLYWKFGL
jgi:uncharacterized membrane protein